jgi:hypothetical protein
MSSKRVLALVGAALVAGLALGTITSAWAATPAARAAASGNTAVAGACGLGLRLGTAVRDAGGRLADVVAKLTGLSAAQVQEKRAAGQSFTQIAKDKGVSSSAVITQALAVRKAALDAKVKSGAITQAQADAALAQMKTRLLDRVSSTAAGCTGAGIGSGAGGACGMGGGRGRGAGRMGGGCGGACTAAPTAPTTAQ